MTLFTRESFGSEGARSTAERERTRLDHTEREQDSTQDYERSKQHANLASMTQRGVEDAQFAVHGCVEQVAGQGLKAIE